MLDVVWWHRFNEIQNACVLFFFLLQYIPCEFLAKISLFYKIFYFDFECLWGFKFYFKINCINPCFLRLFENIRLAAADPMRAARVYDDIVKAIAEAEVAAKKAMDDAQNATGMVGMCCLQSCWLCDLFWLMLCLMFKLET